MNIFDDNLTDDSSLDYEPVKNEFYPPNRGHYTDEQRDLLRKWIRHTYEAIKNDASIPAPLGWNNLAGWVAGDFETLSTSDCSDLYPEFRGVSELDIGSKDFLRLFAVGYPYNGGWRFHRCNDELRLVAIDCFLTAPENSCWSGGSREELHKTPVNPRFLDLLRRMRK